MTNWITRAVPPAKGWLAKSTLVGKDGPIKKRQIQAKYATILSNMAREKGLQPSSICLFHRSNI